MARRGMFSAAALLSSASAVALSVAAAQAQEADSAPAEQADTIVVRGAFIPDEKRATSEISSLVDSADFALTGDADAAAALTRVTGLSLQRGRFVIVRGLNERYTNATLNGSPLPSPEPLRRVAPLDLFPTNVLDTVLVQKTYSPEYSLEFAGGIVDLRTLAVPTSRFAEIQVSTGYNTEITGDDSLLHAGGDRDWTGYGDDVRDLPADLRDSFFQGGFPTDEAVRNEITNQLADPRLLVLQSGTAQADGGMEINVGDRFDVSPLLSVGVIGAYSYDNSWSARNGIRSDRTESGLSELNYDRERAENELTSSGLASIGFDIGGDHEIKFTGLLARSTEKATERRSNVSDPSSEEGVRDITQWFERQAWTGQVAGSHFLPFLNDASLEWRASYSEALRDAPFGTNVFYRNGLEEGVINDTDVRFNWELLNDQSQDVGVDLEVPVGLGALDLIVKGGWTYREQERDSINREYNLDTIAGDIDRTLRIDSFVAQPSLLVNLDVNPNGVPESFFGRLEQDGYYLSGDIQLGPYIRAQAGVRHETATQIADAFTRDDQDADVNRVIEFGRDADYTLPAGTITWNFFDNQQVRFGYSQTITRPQFRELAPQTFRNNITDTLSQGNPRLRDTEITNYDLRYEWYFARDEFFTLGAFYKEIENPIIEYTRTAEDSTFTQFLNAPIAFVEGIELEFEKAVPLPGFLDFDFLGEKEYFFATNYTFTNSRLGNSGLVETFNRVLPPGQEAGIATCGGEIAAGQCVVGQFQFSGIPAANLIDSGTALQGQSDHLFNLQLGYEDYEARSRARLLLNYNSERILFLQSDDGTRPDTIERPPFTLDFRYTRAWDLFNREVEFAFSARNLLNDDYEAYRTTEIGESLFDQYELGRSFSISLTGRF